MTKKTKRAIGWCIVGVVVGMILGITGALMFVIHLVSGMEL